MEIAHINMGTTPFKKEKKTKTKQNKKTQKTISGNPGHRICPSSSPTNSKHAKAKESDNCCGKDEAFCVLPSQMQAYIICDWLQEKIQKGPCYTMYMLLVLHEYCSGIPLQSK